MGRPRKGSAYEADGAIVVAVSTWRPGEPRKRWVRRCADVAPRANGLPITEKYAESVAEDFQHRYDHGTWRPTWEKRPKRAAEPSAPSATAPASLTVDAYAAEWARLQRYETAAEDRATLARYLTGSALGAMPIADVRATQAIAFIVGLVDRDSAMGGKLAPRTVRGCVEVVRRVFDAAVADDRCALNPFSLKPVRKHLPAVEDKDPDARAGWSFTWDEVALLVYSPKVPPDRRVWNALAFATGARPQAAAVLRWRDWDRTTQPLSRLMVVRGRKRGDGREGSGKTRVPMPCPVVPALERILAAWWESGWREHYGRAPTRDDLIVPTIDLAIRKQGRVNRFFKADCKRVEIRERFSYVARHAFATNVVDDGADAAIVEQITHAPPRKAVTGYRRLPWGRLCAEMGKLRFPTGTQGAPPESGVLLHVLLQNPDPSSNPESFSVGATGFEGAADATSGDGPRHSEGLPPGPEPLATLRGDSATCSATDVAAPRGPFLSAGALYARWAAGALWQDDPTPEVLS